MCQIGLLKHFPILKKVGVWRNETPTVKNRGNDLSIAPHYSVECNQTAPNKSTPDLDHELVTANAAQDGLAPKQAE